VKKAAVVDDEIARRKALVKELDALVAQGPLHYETDTDSLTDESQVLLTKIAAQMHRVSKVRVEQDGGGRAHEPVDEVLALARTLEDPEPGRLAGRLPGADALVRQARVLRRDDHILGREAEDEPGRGVGHAEVTVAIVSSIVPAPKRPSARGRPAVGPR
jgi:hypothetical protein